MGGVADVPYACGLGPGQALLGPMKFPPLSAGLDAGMSAPKPLGKDVKSGRCVALCADSQLADRS